MSPENEAEVVKSVNRVTYMVTVFLVVKFGLCVWFVVQALASG